MGQDMRITITVKFSWECSAVKLGIDPDQGKDIFYTLQSQEAGENEVKVIKGYYSCQLNK